MLLGRNNTLEILERLKSKVPMVRVGSVLEEPKVTVPEKPKNNPRCDVPWCINQLS